MLCGHLKRWAEATDLLAPLLNGLDAEALALFLTAAVEMKRPEMALAQLAERRVTPLPSDPQFLWAHGTALALTKRLAEAESVLLTCLAEYPGTVEAHEGLAYVYGEMKEPERELAHARECVRLSPGSARARIRLTLACSERGLVDEARSERIVAESLGLETEGHSVRLFVMLSDPIETGRSFVDASRLGFAALPPSPPARRRTAPRIASGRRVRVGYITGECRATPSLFFYQPFLSQHDRSSIDVFIYCCNPLRDHVTPLYMHWAEHWRDCLHVDDGRLAEIVRADDLDVLVDLSGHFIFNRLWVLAGRLAPVQASYPNFPSTTGCPAMDYLFTDLTTSPLGSEPEYVERLHRIAGGYLKYAPPDNCPEVGPLPMRTRGRPTFGVFQRLSKFSEGVWDAIAAVLHETPESHLLIQNGDRELDRPESDTARAIRQRFASRGIGANRLTLKGPLWHHQHLSAVTQVDVALDTFPYAGQTTTCEALWMGVPVVTLPGSTHVSRVGAGILTSAGHPEWIADSPASYVAIASSLASNAARLDGIRHGLRRDAEEGGLTDGAALARALEAAYHTFTREWP